MAGRQLYMAAVAGVAGITTVSITARVVSEYAPQNPFSLRGDRFDQRTFVGRWFKMLVRPVSPPPVPRTLAYNQPNPC